MATHYKTVTSSMSKHGRWTSTANNFVLEFVLFRYRFFQQLKDIQIHLSSWFRWLNLYGFAFEIKIFFSSWHYRDILWKYELVKGHPRYMFFLDWNVKEIFGDFSKIFGSSYRIWKICYLLALQCKIRIQCNYFKKMHKRLT